MAHLSESMVVIKVSKLLRDNEDESAPLNNDVLAQLEAVLEELVGDPKALIEIIKE